MMRHTVLWLATFGGGSVIASGALAVAGSWALAVLVFGVGSVLLAGADRRLREIERVVLIAYGAGRDEVWVDEAGPFGWIGGGS